MATISKREGLFLGKGALLQAISQYNGQDDAELSFSVGDILKFVEKDDFGWISATDKNGKTGWCPKTALEWKEPEKVPEVVRDDSKDHIENSSLLRDKRRNSEKLESFLKGRVLTKTLMERNILPEEAQTNTVFAKNAIALQKNIEKTRKKGVIASLFVRKKTCSLFGISLNTLFSLPLPGPSPCLPRFVSEAIETIRQNGMKEEGIFRISGNFGEVEKLKAKCTSTTDVLGLEQVETSVISSFFKLWLQALPEPLVPYDTFEIFKEANGFNKEDKEREFRIAIEDLPTANFLVLKDLIILLNLVSKYSEINKMTPKNLSIVFGPTLMRPRIETAESLLSLKNNEICEYLINNPSFFTDCQQRKLQIIHLISKS